jgi:hypothetical protein
MEGESRSMGLLTQTTLTAIWLRAVALAMKASHFSGLTGRCTPVCAVHDVLLMHGEIHGLEDSGGRVGCDYIKLNKIGLARRRC